MMYESDSSVESVEIRPKPVHTPPPPAAPERKKRNKTKKSDAPPSPVLTLNADKIDNVQLKRNSRQQDFRAVHHSKHEALW